MSSGIARPKAMAVSQGKVPDAARKYVPRYPLVSSTLIGRLAVATDQRGQHLGSILLADALEPAFESASAVGSSMVIVDALDEAAAGCAARNSPKCRTYIDSSCRPSYKA